MGSIMKVSKEEFELTCAECGTNKHLIEVELAATEDMFNICGNCSIDLAAELTKVTKELCNDI